MDPKPTEDRTTAVRIVAPDLSRWRESSTGVAYVQERDSGTPGPEVLVTALVHGNEYSGAIALDAFLASGIEPARGRITAAFCNVAAFERFDPANPDASRFVDEDFNRVWAPDRLESQADTAELRRARQLRPFVDRCTHLLDLHSMSQPGPALLLTGLLPHNVEFARRLRCGGQIVIDEGHANGLRMRDYEGHDPGAGARVALLLEAGQHWEPESVTTAADALMRFLLQTGSLLPNQVPGGWLQPDAAPSAALRVTHAVVAASADFAFAREFRGGEIIPQAGTVIATDAGTPVLTPYDDCVLVMPSIRQLRPGLTAVRLGRRVIGD